MDCQTCNDLLLDLAYGELDEVRAAAARKHLDGCVECRGAFERISRGRGLARRLQLDEPPPVSSVLRSALDAQAARFAEAAASQGAATGGAPDPVESLPQPTNVIGLGGRDRRLSRWFERAGELAMRRQVAMAAVFLLMIGVGLLFYQSHPRPTDAQDDRVPDVVPAVEVTGSPTNRATESGAPRPLAPSTLSARERDEQQQARRGSVQQQQARATVERTQEAMPSAHGASGSGASRALAGNSLENPMLDTEIAPSVLGSNSNTYLGSGSSTGSIPQAPGRMRSTAQTDTPAAPAAAPSVPAPTTLALSNAVAPAGVNQLAQNAPSNTNADSTIAMLQTELANAPDEATRARIRQRLIAAYERQGMIAEANSLRAQAPEPAAAASNINSAAGAPAGMAELQQAVPTAMPTAAQAGSVEASSMRVPSTTSRTRGGATRRTNLRRPAPRSSSADAFENAAY